MVQPLVKTKIVKKHTKKFKRHQYDRKIAVKVASRLLSLIRRLKVGGAITDSAKHLPRSDVGEYR